jgi:hypothetical protein
MVKSGFPINPIDTLMHCLAIERLDLLFTMQLPGVAISTTTLATVSTYEVRNLKLYFSLLAQNCQISPMYWYLSSFNISTQVHYILCYSWTPAWFRESSYYISQNEYLAVPIQILDIYNIQVLKITHVCNTFV